ncbi:uncharacterized protein BXZ73DRAFT_88761 [Epithele typhae]|uniref:uncharacterized protein n=1 Tax=Epithele typhae TaxID=378194 RepID=UPI00200796F7|nr:uncharacterized protein BXZ73DRAFT_88761 [Epithele typhae]KAH9940544.1 hypothetical protein BXZ73DRAFT_88761 [Epithele typhae]
MAHCFFLQTRGPKIQYQVHKRVRAESLVRLSLQLNLLDSCEARLRTAAPRETGIELALGTEVHSGWVHRKDPPAGAVLPPLYSEYHAAELQLPQHNWSKTQPDWEDRFFFVAGHTSGLGWGNALQEHLLNAYLAYQSGRTLVFDNYTWSDDGSLYTKYKTRWIPSQIPYTALVRGPVVGGSFPDGEHTAPAVARQYFDSVCHHKVEEDSLKFSQGSPGEFTASTLIGSWSRSLRESAEACIQTTKKSGPIFTHHHVFGVRNALLDAWPTLSASPIFSQFGWSPLVELAFDYNRHLFLPPFLEDGLLTGSPSTSSAERYSMIPGLMVVHIRRGDYEAHCTNLAERSEDFVGVNAFPSMPDHFTVPPHHQPPGRNVKVPAETIEHYRRRCYPTVPEIVHKLREVRQSAAGHDAWRLFIMTNGDAAFIGELKDAVWRSGMAWDAIASSRDLALSRGQRYIAQAVDQLIAQRAQVLVGNGFSTLTSTAVMMRLANGFDAQTNRFW